MIAPIAAAGPSAAWYLTRSTGAVSLLLLTLVIVLGVIDVRRISTPRWPRFVVDSLHRNAALLVVSFLVVHILTAVLDSFTKISLTDAIVPFAGSYRPFWLGLGALAFDLLLAVTITSMLRQRIGHRTWRVTHWLSYASWPIALVHGLGTGSDTKGTWMLALELGCLAAVFAAVAFRVVGAWSEYPDRGRLTIGGGALFGVFLAVWLPTGPLGSEWARRSGTPSPLLSHSTHHPKPGETSK